MVVQTDQKPGPGGGHAGAVGTHGSGAQAVVSSDPTVGKQLRIPKPEAAEEVPILKEPERFVEAPHGPDQRRRKEEPVNASPINVLEQVRDHGAALGMWSSNWSGQPSR